MSSNNRVPTVAVEAVAVARASVVVVEATVNAVACLPSPGEYAPFIGPLEPAITTSTVGSITKQGPGAFRVVRLRARRK